MKYLCKSKVIKKIWFSGYSIVMFWTQPVGVIVLAFPWRFWLAINSGTGSAVPTFVGNSQLVEDVNLPPWLKICIMIWFRNYLALLGMLDAWHSVLEASQSCDILTIGLTNKYYKWAIKLFGNYKKSMMIRKVYWMCYKSDEKLW